MRLILTVLLMIAAYVVSADAAARDYSIRTLTGTAGLSCNQIETLYIDPDGLLWLGTGNTVERYDGKEYLTWSFEQQTDFPGENKITAITRDASGEYWAGSIQGVWKLNPSTFRLDRVLEEIKIPVSRLAADSDNRIYIATIHGLYVYGNGKLQHLMFDKTDNTNGNFMVDMAVENPANVWGLTPDGVVRINSETGTFNKYTFSDSQNYGALKCFVKIGNTLYIGTEKKGLLKFSISSGAYTGFINHWNSPILSLCRIDGTTLAIGTANDGLSLVDVRNGSVVCSAACSSRNNSGLASNSVSAIAAKGNNIWCGNPYYIGFSHLRSTDTEFRLFETGDFKTANIPVRSFLHTPRYTFTGTRDGFYVTDRQTARTVYLAKGQPGAEALRSNLIFSFFKYGDEYLVGTCFGGLYRFDPESMTLSSPEIFSGMASTDIFSYMALDHSNRLWIPTRGGLFRYDQAKGEVQGYTTMNSKLPGNIVYCVLIDSVRRFWVATDKGVRNFNPDKGIFTVPKLPDHLLNNAVVTFTRQDSRGNLFFVTLHGELWMADRDLRQCRRLFSDRNLIVRNIIEDDMGNYWLGTATGVVKTDRNMNVLAVYSSSDRVPDLEANPGSPLWKDADGRIWMAGVKGLVEITPSRNVCKPAPMLVSASVDGKTVMDISTTGMKTVRLDDAHNNVTFRITDSSYSGTNVIHWEYKLKGYDEDWHTWNGEGDISYYNLPRGSYRLMVRPYLGNDVTEMIDVKVGSFSLIWIWCVTALAVLACAWVIYSNHRRVMAAVKYYILKREAETGKEDTQAEPEPKEGPKPKFTEHEMEEMSIAVKKYLQESKAYLNPDFKQPDLASATGYSSQALSIMFNRYLHTGYYDFINTYRIDTFKRLISEGANEKYTLMTIAGKSGFKSHTSFFRTFKKFTGMTPNDYIRQRGQPGR